MVMYVCVDTCVFLCMRTCVYEGGWEEVKIVNLYPKNHFIFKSIHLCIFFSLQQADADLESGIMLVRSLIKLKEFPSATKKLESLRSLHGDQPQLLLSSAILKKAEGDVQQALQLLEQFVKVL